MRLVLFDLGGEHRRNFYPVALSRPIWELRCGMTSIGDKLVAKLGIGDVACFVPPYMAASYKAKTSRPVNDFTKLAGDDLLLVSGRLKAAGLKLAATGKSEVGLDAEGQVLYVRAAKADANGLANDSLEAFVDAAKAKFPQVPCDTPTWNYIWDLVLANPEVLKADFASAGRSGIEGSVEEPHAVRGSKKDVYIAKGAVIHPMVVIDAEHGPVYLDEGVEVHPFTRIEGPCYVGPKSILLGAKCREGNSIGPMCRIGGKVEESIIHGYSNKYHDGFLGHAYVGEWVNLGALTTNSDLKNDYGSVEVVLDGKRPISTGSTKVGSLIGDHTKTSIATLFNTGSYVGAMCLVMANGKPLAKYIPDFVWLLDGAPSKGYGKSKLYLTAKVAMSRRKKEWTAAEEAMWDAIFDMTAPQRDEALTRARRQRKTQ